MIPVVLVLLAVCAAGHAQQIDLLEKAAQARWSNLDGQTLVFGRDQREQGTVKYEQGMALEDGKTYDRVLFIHPPWKGNGAVYGGFDNITIPENDPKLVFTAGFNQGAMGTDGVSLGVRFLHAGAREGAEGRRMRATSQLGSASQNLQMIQLRFDRQLNSSEISLEAFAGQTGTLVLVVNAGASADKDWTVLTELKILSGKGAGAGAGERSKQVVKNLKGHTGRLYAVRFSPDGRFVVTGSADTTARVWEVPSGKLQTTLRGHSAHVFGVDFSPNSKRVVTASGDGTAAVWQAENGNRLVELKGHSKGVLAAVFSPDGARIATAGDDGTVKLWQAASGNEIKTLQIGSGGVYALHFHPNGRLLAVGSTNGGLGIWNTDTGRQVRSFQGHSRAVSSVAFAGGGNRLVSAGVDNTAKIWNAGNGNRLQNLTGGLAHHSAAFHPNGRYVVTGNDGRASIWSAAEGKRVLTVRHVSETPVRSVDFHRNGRFVVLAGEDGVARIWEVDLE
jgi:WD40 repeat protein